MYHNNEYPKELIKRIRTLPNVSEFIADSRGLDAYAAIFGYYRSLRGTKYIEFKEGKRHSIYLRRQMKRLSIFAIKGERGNFTRLAFKLLRKSVVFRLYGLNSVLPGWYLLPERELRRLWRKLSRKLRRQDCDLEFSRRWISKNEEAKDYSRPLGVPTIEWRVISLLNLEIIERWFQGRNLLEDFQHGGRSSRGLVTCWKAIYPKLQAKCIFEFDLKGFFDNVSQDRIVEILERELGSRWSSWVRELLKAKPKKFFLPPVEEDASLKPWLPSNEKKPYYESQTIAVDGTVSYSIDEPDMKTEPIWLPDLPRNLTGSSQWMLMLGVKPHIGSMAYEECDTSLDGNDIFGNLPYKMNINHKISEDARALGRDRRKGLGQEGKGVPQGLGLSPFLATLLTHHWLSSFGAKGQLIMYMDDGLLFADSKEEMINLIQEFKEKLGIIGVELSAEKSRWVKQDGEWLKDCKFLGLEIHENGTRIRSKTRSGTSVEIPMTSLDWPSINKIAEGNYLDVSTAKKALSKVVNTSAFEAGIKYGFLGCVIAASQYKDNLPMKFRQQEIRDGVVRSKWRHFNADSDAFIWKHQDLFPLNLMEGGIEHHNLRLSALSSIMAISFLRREL